MTSNSDELAGFRKLYNFSRLLLESDDPENLLTRLVEATRKVTSADEVILFEIKGGQPEICAVASDAPDGEGETRPEYSKTLVDEVIQRGSPLLLQDVCDDPRFEEAKSVQVLSITSAMGAPLFHKDKLKGIIYASRQRLAQNFTDKHCELMTVAASQASLLMDRLAAMEALRESELRHRSLVEMSPSTIAVIQEGRLVFANQRACELWDCSSVDELKEETSDRLFDPWRSQNLVENLEMGQDFDTVYAWTRGCDGSPAEPVKVVGRAIQFDGKEAMQLRVSEINDRDSIFTQRLRADRLMLMGTMAATVGHEINNPLSYVYTNLDFVYEEVLNICEDEIGTASCDEVLEEVVRALESAREGMERIRSVVDGVQDFTRLEEGEEEPSTIEEPLKSSLRIAREKLVSEVEIQVDIRPTAPVPLSAARLGQVMLNILINAAQALGGKGEKDDQGRLEVRTREAGEQVIVEIADNGPGIEPQIRRHIFEPFVSTKGDEMGTGLGLSICRQIVESVDGTIEVESEVGEGSLFRIQLPAVNELDTQRFEVVPEGRSKGGGRVLIVDPEPTLGRSLQRVLQDRHDVTAVHTTGEAVDLLTGSHDFDVILCDHRLRGGVGRDLFLWVEEHAPQYWNRLVAMTASRLDQRSREYLDELPNPWISKPFDINRLRAIIDRLMDQGKSDVSAS